MPPSSQEIAAALRELAQFTLQRSPRLKQRPKVSVFVDLSSDRLGVQVAFDGAIQEPGLYGEYRELSPRTLDNLFLNILDEQGVWDEQTKRWYVNESKGISLVLGLLAEFEQVLSIDNSQPVSVASEPLQARLGVRWLDKGAELDMCWLLPEAAPRAKQGELLGNGPYWVPIDNRIYPVAPAAAKIAALFPARARIFLPRARIGHLLEVLNNSLYDPALIEIRNPDLQPASEIKEPTPVLELQRKELSFEHFASQNKIELEAALDFEYPHPPPDQNLVYLPNRSREKEYTDFLSELGFEYNPALNRYSLSEDFALDLIGSRTRPFPPEWKLIGLEQLKKNIRLANLTVSVLLHGAADQAAQEGINSKRPRLKKNSTQWFDCQVSLLLNNAGVPLSTIFKNSHGDTDRWLRLDNGAYAPVPGGTFAQLKTLLGILDPNFRLNNAIRTRLSAAQAVGLSRSGEPHFQIVQDKTLRQIRRMLDEFSGIKAIKPGRNFNGKLRPYQEEGLGWLYFLNQFHFNGILADEMGLGKTVQALALLQYLKDQAFRQKKRNKPALVIAPTSVISNWRHEAARFTPKLKVLLLHGPNRKDLFAELPNYDLVITSYALLRLDRYELEKIDFGYVVLDEAQLIKNYQAATTIAAKSLRAEKRLALTGTPTENRPLELWSIFDYLMPGYLGSSEFFRQYVEKPILEGGPHLPVAAYLKSRTRPFIMRRTKAQVEKDLPPKVESVLYVDMTDAQSELYLRVLSDARSRVLDAVAKKGVAGASISILSALMRLRQVCNHPNSVDALRGLAGYESGKFNLLKDLLEEALAAQRKILLFCQFIEMLSIIRRYLEKAGVSYLYLDGATRNRQELIDRFNSDLGVRLFLISLKAGGLGLNLAAADTVIIYDPWWNPAVENQAVDRAHRIGQHRTVNVYRLVTENSIEQKIMNLKRKKAALVEALIDENGLSTLSLSKAEVENLFALS